jgi:hypothetical protein
MPSEDSPFSPEKWPNEADEYVVLSQVDRLYKAGDAKTAIWTAALKLQEPETSEYLKIQLASRIVQWGVSALQSKALKNLEAHLISFLELALKELPLSFIGTIASDKALKLTELLGTKKANDTELENAYHLLLLVEFLQLQTGNQELSVIKSNLLSMLAEEHDQRKETLLAHIYADDLLTVGKNFQTYWTEFAQHEPEIATEVAAIYFLKLLEEDKFLESLKVIQQAYSLGKFCFIRFAAKIILPPSGNKKYIHTIQCLRYLVGANKHLDELIEVLTNNRLRYFGTTSGKFYDLLKEDDYEEDFFI